MIRFHFYTKMEKTKKTKFCFEDFSGSRSTYFKRISIVEEDVLFTENKPAVGSGDIPRGQTPLFAIVKRLQKPNFPIEYFQ